MLGRRKVMRTKMMIGNPVYECLSTAKSCARSGECHVMSWSSALLQCDYRENHKFLNPSCLCALLKLQGKGEAPRYTEAAIYLLLNECYKGEWVAECAKDYCRYLGRFLIPLEIDVLTPCC